MVDLDAARVLLVRQMMAAQGYEAIVTRSPAAVLMTSGYASPSGSAFCFLRQSGITVLLVPEAEADWAREASWVDDIRTYPPTREGYLDAPAECALPALREILGRFGRDDKIGVEHVPAYVTGGPEIGIPDRASAEAIKVAGYRATWYDCSDLIEAAAMWKSAAEVARLREIGAAVDSAWGEPGSAPRAGATEAGIASGLLAALAVNGAKVTRTGQVQAFVDVLSGANTRRVVFGFGRFTGRTVASGEPVIVQTVLGVDGLWLYSARTFFAGSPSPEMQQANELVGAAARDAAHAVSNGVLGSDVDAAARAVFRDAGKESNFGLQTGHGVGHHVLSRIARPMLDPGSVDSIRPNQAFTIAPLYAGADFAVLHADSVLFGGRGLEHLTSGLRDLQDIGTTR